MMSKEQHQQNPNRKTFADSVVVNHQDGSQTVHVSQGKQLAQPVGFKVKDVTNETKSGNIPTQPSQQTPQTPQEMIPYQIMVDGSPQTIQIPKGMMPNQQPQAPLDQLMEGLNQMGGGIKRPEQTPAEANYQKFTQGVLAPLAMGGPLAGPAIGGEIASTLPKIAEGVSQVASKKTLIPKLSLATEQEGKLMAEQALHEFRKNPANAKSVIFDYRAGKPVTGLVYNPKKILTLGNSLKLAGVTAATAGFVTAAVGSVGYGKWQINEGIDSIDMQIKTAISNGDEEWAMKLQSTKNELITMAQRGVMNTPFISSIIGINQNLKAKEEAGKYQNKAILDLAELQSVYGKGLGDFAVRREEEKARAKEIYKGTSLFK